jgi:hypothetical protein
MPTLNQGINILLQTINSNLRHVDYKRVNEIALDFTTYVTGQGVSENFNGLLLAKVKRCTNKEFD